MPTEVGVAAQMANLEQLVLDNMRKFFFEKRQAEPEAIVEADWQRLLPALRELAKSEAERMPQYVTPVHGVAQPSAGTFSPRFYRPRN